ncbi:hypothetical protein [Streptacidiphilus rugosus]|uniref:hypothetical protein n=1 Tax=Streptacidiphilus rugosus TaxID=405783 RepID=UPI000562C446|nr:hypothetical protein [Streptacidiphilus rugosus]
MGSRNVRKKITVLGSALIALGAFTVTPVAASAAGHEAAAVKATTVAAPHSCASNVRWCTEVDDSELVFGEGHYVGHDEPSVLYYSDKAGAGNDNTYTVRLPKDPPTQPRQDGSGSTWNFQLHPAFWLGMAMCDDQSAPGPASGNASCAPDSDSNIYNSADPSSPRYIGKHPGSAFMEMQFYPPGWVPWPAGVSCDPTQWCAALNIDSLSLDYNKGLQNNNACLASAGVEYVNFAFLTKDGRATTPADPTNGDRFNLDPAKDFFMKSGDTLKVHLFDTRAGFKVEVNDTTAHRSGSMTASVGNGFAQVKFDPTATSCTTLPSAFHPEYSTSSEATRVPWAAHSYNTAYSDEIGHFEYCAAADPATGVCTQSAGSEALDPDDNGCFNPGDSLLVRIGGCLGNSPTDDDYDGVTYQNTWPGTGSPAVDRATKPTAIVFSSPTFRDGRQFQRVAFETDLPRIEDNDTLANPCDRTTGVNCVNPPPGANFYPFYSTTRLDGSCVWQEGGANIPGTRNTFGGDSQKEFGGLLQLAYPGVGNQPRFVYNDFRQVLDFNPCRASQ